MVVSDNVTVAIVSSATTLITSLLAFILAIQAGNRTRLDNIHTLVNSNYQEMKQDLAQAVDVIKTLQRMITTTPALPPPDNKEGPGA